MHRRRRGAVLRSTAVVGSSTALLAGVLSSPAAARVVSGTPAPAGLAVAGPAQPVIVVLKDQHSGVPADAAGVVRRRALTGDELAAILYTYTIK
jgi:hypothetical protein